MRPELPKAFRAQRERAPKTSVFACLLPLLLGLASCATAPGQSAETQKTAPTPKPKIAVIGASVSAGFEDGPLTGGSAENRSVPLATVLKHMWQDAKLPPVVLNLSDPFMFRSAPESGAVQLKRAIREDPDLLIAIDFAFWFVYGTRSNSNRKEKLELCLTMLDHWKKPILLGDIPDMTGASARLMRASMIPDLKIQNAINARLREWAKTRSNVTLLPLAQWVRELKTDGFEFVNEDGDTVKAPAGSLLQLDDLHVTRVGMAVFATRLAASMRKALPGTPFAQPSANAETLSEAVGADFEYEDLIEEIGAAKAAPPKGGMSDDKRASATSPDSKPSRK